MKVLSSSTISKNSPPKSLKPKWLKIPSWLRETFKSTSQKQLECVLIPLEKFLKNYAPPPTSPTKGTPTPSLSSAQLFQMAKELVDETKKELAEHRIEEAWGSFYEAELLQYQLMQKEELVEQARKILFTDINVLDNDEKKCVQKSIGTSTSSGDWDLKQGDDLTKDEIIGARKVVQNHYNNKYFHLSLSLAQLSILATIALVASLLIIVTTHYVPNNIFTFDLLSAGNFTATSVTSSNFNATNFAASNFTATNITASSSNQISSSNLLFWIAVGLFGALGGAISGIYGLKDAFTSSTDMPESVLNKWLTVARPAVGFAAAVAIAYFLIAGLVQVADITVSNYLLYVMAFISGFSERLIIGSVQQRLPSTS